MREKAGTLNRPIDRLTLGVLSDPPSPGRSVFLGVLDHKLNVLGRPRNKGLFAAKDFVVLLRRDETPRQPCNNRAIRQRQFSFPISLDRRVIA